MFSVRHPLALELLIHFLSKYCRVDEISLRFLLDSDLFVFFWVSVEFLPILLNDSNVGTNSFKYFQTGASLIWNSSGLAMALNKYVKSENLDAFEFKHIEILAGCLVREIDPKEKERWLEIYGDLQRYIFVSLAAPRQCKIASHIIKKVFLNKDLSESVMEVSLRFLFFYSKKQEEATKNQFKNIYNFF